MSFFDVGRYAAYIWPAYGITAALLGGLVAHSLVAARRWKQAADRLQAEADAARAEERA